VDLIHPHTKHDVADAVREAAANGTRLLVVGGRTHMGRGNPVEADAELWTTMMDEVVAYEPAEMLAVVEAGMRVGEMQAVLGEGGQEWPVDAPHDATVGGVIAAGASSFRRLRLGHVRDTVVELELVRGDGLLVKSGARTVKNVTGYDVHRLATGSLGTLGVIVQVALKLRPLPQVRSLLTIEGDGLELGRRLLETVPLPSAVVAEPGRVRVWLEGWADEIEEQTAAARTVDPALTVDHHPTPFDPLSIDAATVVEAAVTPSRIADLVAGRDDWTALLGVGLVWFALDGSDPDALGAIRSKVAGAGGIAPVIKGNGGLGPAAMPAVDVHRRLKASFDPAGILAPGRFWGDT
jgi:glycolate dehydrogenase FAD-binding subunit